MTEHPPGKVFEVAFYVPQKELKPLSEIQWVLGEVTKALAMGFANGPVKGSSGETIGSYNYGKIDTVGQAAPDLLEALEGLAKRHEGYEHGCGPCVCEWHQKARAAIAKAKGE